MIGNTTPWVKATASDGEGNCVQMRSHDGAVQVRDTKQRGLGPVLELSPATFADWLRSAKEGELDA